LSFVRKTSTTITALTAAVIGYLGQAAPAQASDYGIELNGTYRVISNGDWAKTNDMFMDEKTVVQAWTVSSSCASPLDCTGEVTSDQGWTAPLKFINSRWLLRREIPNWMPCPDGTAAPGRQHFLFWGVNAQGLNIPTNTASLAGWDETEGPSGACGVNKQLVIRLPVRLEKLT
jgi:hypothetical protein